MVSAEESRHERALKRAQLILAVLVGASWIRKLGAPKTDTQEANTP